MPYTEKSLGLFLGGSLRRPVLVSIPQTFYPRPCFNCRGPQGLHLHSVAPRLTQLLTACTPCTQEHNDINKNTALSYAAYRTCIFLMPYYASYWNDTMKNLALPVDTDNVDPTDPVGIGNLAGAAPCLSCI